jgi:hypothetical protein
MSQGQMPQEWRKGLTIPLILTALLAMPKLLNLTHTTRDLGRGGVQSGLKQTAWQGSRGAYRRTPPCA